MSFCLLTASVKVPMDRSKEVEESFLRIIDAFIVAGIPVVDSDVSIKAEGGSSLCIWASRSVRGVWELRSTLGTWR